MRQLLTVLCAAMLVGGHAGCRTVVKEKPAPQFLVEGFEAEHLWTLDSADNYGIPTRTDDYATEGRCGLSLLCYNNARDKTLFRREVRCDMRQARRAWIDVFNHSPATDIQCALGFWTRKRGLFETRPRRLAAGENRDLAFDVSAAGLKEGTDTNAWLAACGSVTRLLVLVFPGKQPAVRVDVDNLRMDVPGVTRGAQPEILQFHAPPRQVEQYEPFELPLEVVGSSLLRAVPDTDPVEYEMAPVLLQARCRRPDGEREAFHGFLKERDLETDRARYALRFFLDDPGDWQMDLGVECDGQWHSLWQGRVYCRRSETKRGPVRVDPADRTRFSFENGLPFDPVGQNVCWAADYAPYLEAMQAYGGNIIRVWLCPWNNPLLTADEPEEINLDSAAAIDRLLMQAADRAVQVQLVFTYHGAFREDWDRNPFNAVNGGPCALPHDFWVDRRAQAKFKAVMDYAVRRWSVFPNLFAWELINEANLAPRYENRDVIRWHREMSDYLKRIDPYEHLVTTSLTTYEPLDKLWELPSIDFVSKHLYRENLTRALNRDVAGLQSYHKPYWIQEIGRGWLASDDQRDPEGRHLHHSLWLSWMSPAAGAAMPWWWDTYIEPLGLHPHFAALAAFQQGEDRRGLHLLPWMAAIEQADGRIVQIQGLIGRTACYGFVYDPEPVRNPGLQPRETMLGAGHSLEIRGLIDGPYAVEQWDTYTGVPVALGQGTCEDSVLHVVLPAAARDFAFKIKPVALPALGITVDGGGQE